MKAILFVFETRCLKVICAVIGLNTTSDRLVWGHCLNFCVFFVMFTCCNELVV